MEVLVEKEQEKQNIFSNELSVIILLEKNIGEIIKPYDTLIWGKKMWEWVAMACDGYIVKTIPCTKESFVLNLIKPLLTNSKYTLVLYSDTPLIKRQTINEILNFAKGKDINVLTLERGYLFNTEYIKNADSISGLPLNKFGDDDFTVASDFKMINKVSQILKNRIINFHLSNGVYIVDPNTTFIDADVIIENGTKIDPNNYIKGTSYIGRNCYIEFGNVVENSIISDGCNIIRKIYNSNI